MNNSRPRLQIYLSSKETVFLCIYVPPSVPFPPDTPFPSWVWTSGSSIQDDLKISKEWQIIAICNCTHRDRPHIYECFIYEFCSQVQNSCIFLVSRIYESLYQQRIQMGLWVSVPINKSQNIGMIIIFILLICKLICYKM